MLVNTLKIKNGQIRISSWPEYANLVPNNTEAILGPKAQNNQPILRANTEKYLYKILWNKLSLSWWLFVISSVTIGNTKVSIGPTITPYIATKAKKFV